MLRPFTLIFLIYTAYFLGCETEINNKNDMSNKNQDTFETTVNIPVKLNYSLYVPDDYDETSSEFPMVLQKLPLFQRTLLWFLGQKVSSVVFF